MQMPVCKACVIPVCQNKKFSLVHKFPADKERFSEWMLSIQRSKPIEKLTSLTDDAIRKRYFVCARHFGLNEYKNVESRSLNLTAVPKFNLEDLSEMHLSKAWQLENSAAPCSEAFFDESDSIKIESPTKILNPSLKVNNKQNISLCRKTEIDTSPTNTSLPPTDIVDVTFKNNLDEPPTKKAKISNAVDITNLEKIKEDHSAIKKQPKVQHKAKDMSNKIKLMVKPNKNKDKKKISGENDKNLSLELKKEESHEESEDKGSNKLLALIEVTSDQYLQLSQSLSSEERNEKITTLLNFMTTNENDQNSSEQELKIKVDEDCSINLDLFWLRDHCRCEACYDHGNYQRKLNILNIPDDIKVSSYEVDNGKVSVIWSDGHESSYDIEFLLKNQPGATPLAAKEICLWNKEIIENPLKTNCRVLLRDYMSDPDVSKKVIENLHFYGVAFIDGVQPTQHNTEFVIRQIFPIHKTLFGEMWSFSDANKDHSDTAYTNGYLGAHNDNTYFNDAAGLHILHCIQHACTGGENFLVDGFQVADKIKKNHPEVFERLTKSLVTAEFIEDGRNHKHTAPIINLDPITGDVVQIRFNIYDRSPLNLIPPTKIRQFYSDLKILMKEIEDPENRITFQLKPGTVMIFDNWRILHGRLAYQGKRTMTGCYVARTEFQSTLRVHNFID